MTARSGLPSESKGGSIGGIAAMHPESANVENRSACHWPLWQQPAGISIRTLTFDATFSVPSWFLLGRIRHMREHVGDGSQVRTDDKQLVALLKEKAGISEAEACKLIKEVGHDRHSLLREARFLKARH
ncbi:hypothetical protein ABID26_000096 [Mesorhizobium shonense]|uniref:DUF3606 domain-containing protein n=1 Tax=Mesorhizobium shonense TaxID=1209948 RepID=A0ABV2HK63_9HYPH